MSIFQGGEVVRILVIGSGGREHALVWKLKQSPRVSEVFVAPGNGGTAREGAINVAVDAGDLDGLVELARKEKIDLVVPGPELPLTKGITDRMREAGIPCFGPDAYCARLEGSKAFAKDVMNRAGVPTAHSQVFTDPDKAKNAVVKLGAPLVVKADGLAAGKGVVVAMTTQEALDIVRAEKKSGKILSLGFQPRMDENMKMIKKVVDSGELGRIYYIQTGGGRRHGIPGSTFIEEKTAGIGALGDIGCYSLDMVLNAIGYPKPLTVSGYRSNYLGTDPEFNTPEDAARFDVDDFAAAFIRLEGGIILDFRIAWAMHLDTPGDTIIMGTKASLRIPSTECWNGSIGGPMKMYKDVAGLPVEFEFPMYPQTDNGQGIFYKKLRSFIDAIKENGTAPVPSSQILYNQAIIDGIVQSAKAGKEVEIHLEEI